MALLAAARGETALQVAALGSLAPHLMPPAWAAPGATAPPMGATSAGWRAWPSLPPCRAHAHCWGSWFVLRCFVCFFKKSTVFVAEISHAKIIF